MNKNKIGYILIGIIIVLLIFILFRAKVVENFENKKTIIHKILKKTTLVNPPGFGDIIKGTIGLYSISKNYNYNFYLDLSNHPISKYIKTTLPNEYNNIKDVVYEFFNGFNIQDHDELPNKIVEKMNKKNIGLFETNCMPSIIKYLNDQDNNDIKKLFLPNDFLQEKLNNIKIELNLNKYSVLHIRSGDDNMNKPVDSKFIKRIENTLSKIHLPDNILLLSDSKEIKRYLNNKYKFKIIESDIIHLGTLNHNNKGLESTLIDFFLLCGAESIYSLSVYTWNSGFSSMASRLYNIPYKITNIKVTIENLGSVPARLLVDLREESMKDANGIECLEMTR